MLPPPSSSFPGEQKDPEGLGPDVHLHSSSSKFSPPPVGAHRSPLEDVDFPHALLRQVLAYACAHQPNENEMFWRQMLPGRAPWICRHDVLFTKKSHRQRSLRSCGRYHHPLRRRTAIPRGWAGGEGRPPPPILNLPPALPAEHTNRPKSSSKLLLIPSSSWNPLEDDLLVTAGHRALTHAVLLLLCRPRRSCRRSRSTRDPREGPRRPLPQNCSELQ